MSLFFWVGIFFFTTLGISIGRSLNFYRLRSDRKENVKGKTKLARSANRARADIERYHLKGYGMRRLEEGGYELTLPCRNEANLKKRIRLLLEDIENEAARDDCVVEAEYEGDEADHAKRGKSEEMEPLTSLCVWNEPRKSNPNSC